MGVQQKIAKIPMNLFFSHEFIEIPKNLLSVFYIVPGHFTGHFCDFLLKAHGPQIRVTLLYRRYFTLIFLNFGVFI